MSNKPVRIAKPDRKEGNCMKVEVRGKNYKVSENLVMIIEKKFAKLDKYFPEEITAEVLTKREADHFKTEASIHAKKHIFRAGVITMEPFDAVDRLVDKLATQMSNSKQNYRKNIRITQNSTLLSCQIITMKQKFLKLLRKNSWNW